MAEIGIAPHIVEAVVNHVSGHKGGVVGVYNKAKYSSENGRLCSDGPITSSGWCPVRRRPTS
jgi:hypothetical protein